MVKIAVGLPCGEKRLMTGDLHVSLVEGYLSIIRTRETGKQYPDGTWDKEQFVAAAYGPGQWDWVATDHGDSE